MKPLHTIFLALFLLLSGWVVLFLMVLGVIAAGIISSMLAYAATVLGLALGIAGVISYRRM